MNRNDNITEQELENYYNLKWALAILRRVQAGQGRHDWELPYAIRRLERLQAGITDRGNQ